ncbi:MAG: hypothetical protein ACOZBL_04365 [Patescibacteria group bacterium]
MAFLEMGRFFYEIIILMMLVLKNVKKYFRKRVPSNSKLKDFFAPKFERFDALR